MKLLGTKNILCTLYIARHGETEWNVKGLVQGHTDSPLTMEGLNQANNLAKELKHIKFDAVFSSDLLRAKKTAEIVALEHELTVQTAEALRERSFGKHEGSDRRVVEILEELSEKQIPYKSVGIESDEQLTGRIVTYLREIAIGYPGKKVLVVTHGGVLIRILIHLGYYLPKQIRNIRVGNTSYIKVASDGVNFFVEATKRIDKRVSPIPTV